MLKSYIVGVYSTIRVAALVLQAYFICIYSFAYARSQSIQEFQPAFESFWPRPLNLTSTYLVLLTVTLIFIILLVLKLANKDSLRMKLLLAFQSLFASFLIVGLM